jgi:hypothetical protein
VRRRRLPSTSRALVLTPALSSFIPCRTATARSFMPTQRTCSRRYLVAAFPLCCTKRAIKPNWANQNPPSSIQKAAWQRLFAGLRDEAGLPATFTLDACRHGGMTELEEAELTDGQGRALSAHKSRAYEGYAKRTMDRALAATRKRHAHRITASSNAQRTEFRNDPSIEFRNDEKEPNVTDPKSL